MNELFGERLDGTTSGNELSEDFRAVAVLVEHFLDPVQLADNFAEAQDVGLPLFSGMMVLVRHGDSLREMDCQCERKALPSMGYGGISYRRRAERKLERDMNAWFLYAVGAALLYGLHQIFTKMASDHISDGLGGFVVEGTAAVTILVYLAWLRFGGKWNQTASSPGVWYSVLTGICVGAGTVLFFLLFQKGGPLSAVPMILAGGAALMAVAGIVFFKEPASRQRVLGIALALAGLFLLKK